MIDDVANRTVSMRLCHKQNTSSDWLEIKSRGSQFKTHEPLIWGPIQRSKQKL